MLTGKYQVRNSRLDWYTKKKRLYVQEVGEASWSNLDIVVIDTRSTLSEEVQAHTRDEAPSNSYYYELYESYLVSAKSVGQIQYHWKYD